MDIYQSFIECIGHKKFKTILADRVNMEYTR